MNKIKVIAALALIAFIGVQFWPNVTNVMDTGEFDANVLDSELKLRIRKISMLPDSQINDAEYRSAINYITNFFGDENPPQRTQALENVYLAYVPKFKEQSFFYLKSNVWDKATLSKIENGALEFSRSPFLQQGQGMAMDLSRIVSIIDLNREIERFLYSCSLYQHIDTILLAQYPKDDLQLLNNANLFWSNQYFIDYVSNNRSLVVQLNSLNRLFFDKRCQYVNSKLLQQAQSYMSYNKGEQPKWSQDIYSPLKKHIDDISQLDYNVDPQYFSIELQKLEQVLAGISRNAINYLN